MEHRRRNAQNRRDVCSHYSTVFAPLRKRQNKKYCNIFPEMENEWKRAAAQIQKYPGSINLRGFLLWSNQQRKRKRDEHVPSSSLIVCELCPECLYASCVLNATLFSQEKSSHRRGFPLLVTSTTGMICSVVRITLVRMIIGISGVSCVIGIPLIGMMIILCGCMCTGIIVSFTHGSSPFREGALHTK